MSLLRLREVRCARVNPCGPRPHSFPQHLSQSTRFLLCLSRRGPRLFGVQHPNNGDRLVVPSLIMVQVLRPKLTKKLFLPSNVPSSALGLSNALIMAESRSLSLPSETRCDEQLVQEGQEQLQAEKALVRFEPPSPPTLVATGPNVMSLQWKKLVLKAGSAVVEVSNWEITYALYMKLVRIHRGHPY